MEQEKTTNMSQYEAINYVMSNDNNYLSTNKEKSFEVLRALRYYRNLDENSSILETLIAQLELKLA